MATMKITLIGFSNYLEAKNDDLFEFLSVPEGIDKNLLINNILLRGGEFEVLYADPDFLKNMIGVWSSKWQHTMERWIKALSIDYNPLENYDRMEEWEDKGSKLSSQLSENSQTGSKNNSSITSGIDTQNRSENAVAQDISNSTGSGNTTNTRSAYDASTYQPHDKTETSSRGDNTSNGITAANSITSNNSAASNTNIENDNTSGNVKSNSFDKSNGLHTGRMHGNIGVTTSQQMLEAELDISKWNIYEEITDLFLNEFCIYLY